MTSQKRRQYGTGSVYQRASDGRWIGTIQAGWTAKGTRRVITVSCSASKGETECKRLLRVKQNEITKHGLPAEGAGSNTTVKSWADEWLPRAKRDLRPKAFTATRSMVTGHIVPAIGRKRLDQLTPGDVRAVADAVRAKGRSSSTAQRAHRDLMQMLRSAVQEGYIVQARVLAVKAPRKAANDRAAFNYDHALTLLDAASAQPDGSRWVAAILQGLRQGECLGLTWDELDLDKGMLTISWQLQPIPFEHGCDGCGFKQAGSCPQRQYRIPDGYEIRPLYGGLCLVRPKSQAGWRRQPLVPWMLQALTAWRDIAPDSPHGLVWPRPDGRPWTAQDDLARWKQLQRVAGVSAPTRPYHLHEARHTTATLLLETGTDPKVVTAILGHASVRTSQLYQHTDQRMAREALDRVAERLQLNAKSLG